MVLRKNLKEHSFTLAAACLIWIFCITLQYCPSIFSETLKEEIAFEQKTPTTWLATIADLDHGHYFLSVGRPRTPCSVFIDNSLASTTAAAVPELHSSLLLGADFSVTPESSPSLITIQCQDKEGFGVRLTHSPVIASYPVGLIIHGIRAFTELLLGPLVSTILFIVILFQLRSVSLTSRSNGQNPVTPYQQIRSHGPHLIFSVVSFFYALSLAYYPMLFLKGSEVFLGHVILRNLFSVGFIIVLNSYSRYQWGLIATHIIAMISHIIIASYSFEIAPKFYMLQYLLFPITTALALLESFKHETRTEGGQLLRALAIAWTISQTIDTISLWSPTGVYIAPAMLASMTGIVAFIKYREKLRSERIEVAAARILSLVEAKTSIQEVMSHLATTLSSESHFTRVSAYVDAFCLGGSDQPHKVFVRVTERGYKKETSKDRRIVFEDGRGQQMLEALKMGNVLMKRGFHDNAWYTIVPIGKHACINLSDSQAVSSVRAYTSKEILTRLVPALASLNGRIMEQAFKQGFALERLRSIRGDGRWDDTIGAIFADINDYSHLSERYGPPFSDFVSATFFPALIKAVSRTAVPEFVRGDEVYLVCIGDLVPEGLPIGGATVEAVTAIRRFLKGEGARLCEENGFVPVEMAIGFSIGVATIVCDPLKVRTTGTLVNGAKRLQEAAPRGGILMRAEDSDKVPTDTLFLGEEFPVLIKKNLILARPVGFTDSEISEAA